MKITLSEYTGINIKCDTKLTKEQWDKLSYSYDRDERNSLLKSIKEYETCKIKKMSGSIQNAWRNPGFCWEKEGFSQWFEISFNTKWTLKESKRLGYPDSSGIGRNIFIDPSMWFTMNRVEIENRKKNEHLKKK